MVVVDITFSSMPDGTVRVFFFYRTIDLHIFPHIYTDNVFFFVF